MHLKLLLATEDLQGFCVKKEPVTSQLKQLYKKSSSKYLQQLLLITGMGKIETVLPREAACGGLPMACLLACAV